MPARCLIVDDEAPARDELRHLLQRFDDVEVVGEATTAEEAKVLVEAVDYDILLLDVRMPGMGGLELARTLQGSPGRPAVVFTTAYTEHAVEAFDLAATDYLVKPFDADRLRRALDRALAGRDVGGGTLVGAVDIASEGSDEVHEADASPASGTATSSTPTLDPARASRVDLGVRLPVHRGDRIILVEEVRVVFAEACRGYAELKLVARSGTASPRPDDRLLTSYTLGDLEERFSDAVVRTHRSFLVNLRHVREVVPQVGGTLQLVMGDRDRSTVPVARRQAPTIRARLGV